VKRYLNFKKLQAAQKLWVKHNFPNRESYYPLLGMIEELGELAHAHLKMLQNIRGTKQKHQTEKGDAIGDIVIYMSDYCTANDINFQDIVEAAWDEVKQRDWIKYPINGVDK